MNSRGHTFGEVTRSLATQWRIVGFEPAFASATTVQSSRAARNLPVSSFDERASGANGVSVDNSESGLTQSSKLGLAIAFPVFGGCFIIGVIVWLIARRSAGVKSA
jgi:hypothetical protein